MKRALKIAGLLAIVAIFAAIVVPDFVKTDNRSKQKRTMADIRSIATAWEARATDAGSYSLQASHIAAEAHDMGNFAQTERITAAELERALVPKYIRKLPYRDGWDRALEFRIGDRDKNGNAQGYAIRSLGRDGSPDTFAYTSHATTNFDEDIVYANGSFVWFPEGT